MKLAQKLADPMEYEEDYVLLSKTKEIEQAIKDKIKIDVGSESFDVFKTSLSQDQQSLVESHNTDVLSNIEFGLQE